MAIKPTTLNINVELRTRLEQKNPGIPFTRLVEMGMELLDNTDNNSVDDKRLAELESKIDMFVKGFKEFKERTNNTLSNIDNRLDELTNE